MIARMRTSDAGIAMIERFEGFSAHVIGDTGGKQEIGFGHDLLPGESFPDGVTLDEARELLASDVAKVDAALSRYAATAALTQCQWDALADFTYECGAGALGELLAHGVDHVPEQLPRWVHARVGGAEQELPGMVARRKAEVDLWLTGSYTGLQS